MARIMDGAKGKTLELTPEDSATLAQVFSSRAATRNLSLDAISAESTLSVSTISSRLRNASNDNLALWTFVALCDALSVDAVKAGKRIAVEITLQDISRARMVVAQRQARRVAASAPEMALVVPTNGNTPAPADDGLGVTNGETPLLEVLQPVVEWVERIVDARIQELLGV